MSRQLDYFVLWHTTSGYLNVKQTLFTTSMWPTWDQECIESHTVGNVETGDHLYARWFTFII